MAGQAAQETFRAAHTHLLVPVNDVSRVDELGSFQELIQDVTLVDLFQQVSLLDDSMQVGLCHKRTVRA